MIEIHPYGSNAILINFEQDIQTTIHDHVLALHQAIVNTIAEITTTIPAYCSLTVCFDATKITHHQLIKKVQALSETLEFQTNTSEAPLITIPVCYEPPFSMDMDVVAQHTGLSPEAIIQQHTDTIFRVYLLGFLPGFAYMGKLPQTLHCPRKTVPNAAIPKGAVGIAGYQTGIYPSVSPGGWQIIGQTPLDVFQPQAEQPFLFQVGMRVQFQAISSQTFYQQANA